MLDLLLGQASLVPDPLHLLAGQVQTVGDVLRVGLGQLPVQERKASRRDRHHRHDGQNDRQQRSERGPGRNTDLTKDRGEADSARRGGLENIRDLRDLLDEDHQRVHAHRRGHGDVGKLPAEVQHLVRLELRAGGPLDEGRVGPRRCPGVGRVRHGEASVGVGR